MRTVTFHVAGHSWWVPTDPALMERLQKEGRMDDKEKTRITIAINDTVQDLVSGFLYYDRKEDEELPRGVIESAINDGTVTEKHIVDLFASEFRARLSDVGIFV